MQGQSTIVSAPPALTSAALALSLLFCLLPGPVFSLDILIGTSQTKTFNHQVGRSLCRMISSQGNDSACEVLAAEEGLHSSDQIHTVTNIQNGALDLGIVDSAIQYNAANGSGRFEFLDIKLDNIRGLFSLNGIPFSVIARDKPGLKTFMDLQGKKVNVGNPGSPQRSIMDSLMRINGWDRKHFQLMEELPAAQSQDTLALCFGTVDAVIRLEVHPNAATRQMIDLCGARLIGVSGLPVDKLLGGKPYYSRLSIPSGIYATSSAVVSTFGLTETVITSEDLDEETAYEVVKLVFEGLDRWLKARHPAFSTLNPGTMHSRGISVPLHPGALRYYRERGWKP